MEFRKMVKTTLYAREQKRHRCIEQSFGFCGTREAGDDNLRETKMKNRQQLYLHLKI